MTFQFFVEHFVSAFFEGALYYGIFAAPFFLLFWVILKKKFSPIRIQEVQRATNHHFKHDVLHSLNNFAIFAILDVFLVYLQSKGYTFLYYDVSQYGWLWIFASFAIMLFVNDTFFYWSHRAMHHPRLYKFFHKVHHESTDPSPLTAFAFHPSEAVVENFVFLVMPFIMPLHFGMLLVFQIFDMLNNVVGHLGYEIYPKYWLKIPILRYKTASTHHNMHHQLFNGNYALYFTWWDKWMGTEFKDYENRYTQIFERKNSKKNNELSFINSENQANESQKAHISAQVFGKKYAFDTDGTQTILQSGLAQNIPLPYSCQRGLCGKCKMKCTAGKVKMQNNQVLTEAEIKAGYILTCQSLPTTEKIAIQN